jgi:hypothetical protein
MENRDLFLKELHDLLEKYSIEICIGLDGDTHGLDSWLSIDHKPNPKSFKCEEILRLNNGELDIYELKPHIKHLLVNNFDELGLDELGLNTEIKQK